MTLKIVFDIGPSILALGAKLLATLDDFNSKLDALDSKVTAIAAEIADLKAQLAAGGLTAEQEATVLARLDTLSASLDAAK